MFSAATKTAAGVTEKLAERDIDNKKDGLKRDASKAAESAVENISDYAERAGHYVRDFVDGAATRIDETNRAVTEEVRESPIKSILIAAAAGFFAGLLARR